MAFGFGACKFGLNLLFVSLSPISEPARLKHVIVARDHGLYPLFASFYLVDEPARLERVVLVD